MYDITIIGAGVVGGCIFRELTKYDCKVLLLEKENDVCCGASKANSAIVHSGYDPEVNTLMAKLNVDGSKIFPKLCEDLSIPYKQNGSLIIGFSEDDKKVLEKLKTRGVANNVDGLKILNEKEVYELEPNLSEGVISALYAPTGGIVGVYEFTIGVIENGVANNGELRTNSEVIDINKIDNNFIIKTSKGDEISTKIIINAAGVYADKIHNLICNPSYEISPIQGQYFVLDKQSVVNTTIFQCPTNRGKGILVTPTVHGNILVGPDYTLKEDLDDLKTTADSLSYIKECSSKTAKLSFNTNIRNFSGLRAYSDRSDFIIEESEDVKGFIDVAGIKSPGLSCAPAIGLLVTDMIKNKIPLKEKENFNPKRNQVYINTLSIEEKNKLIKENPKYGKIICRCENITEGEIIDSITRPVGAKSVEGVKKRCRPGAGRCQGGFCQPKIIDILSRELNIPVEEVCLDRVGSNLLKGEF